MCLAIEIATSVYLVVWPLDQQWVLARPLLSVLTLSFGAMCV